MKSLYLRIYATILVALLLFAAVAGVFVQRHLENERVRVEALIAERLAGWVDLIETSLPPATAPPEQQAAGVQEWSARLRMPLALDDAGGRRIAASESFVRRGGDGARSFPFRFDDGRTLWTMRATLRPFGMGRRPPGSPPPGEAFWWPVIPGLPRATGLVVILGVLFLAVAAGAYPVVRRLTRRLEALQQGVETFGAGRLGHRVAVSGTDEVAAVAASFNTAAARIESLVQSSRSLLANASHELRSPLARLKMAVAMIEEAPPGQRERLRREIDRNIAELDALVEEVLLASRLEATVEPPPEDWLDVVGLVAEEAARVEATVDAGGVLPEAGRVRGDEKLLRRAVRNLLENARRYGGGEVVALLRSAPGRFEIGICDRGPGVPEASRERIFEPFYRLPGHAEREGGVGLGLSLVRQIVDRHRGRVRCEARAGGGSCFTIELPAT